MKTQTIWIIVGVVVLILIIANWNKIFGKSEKKASGGHVSGSRMKTCSERLDLCTKEYAKSGNSNGPYCSNYNTYCKHNK